MAIALQEKAAGLIPMACSPFFFFFFISRWVDLLFFVNNLSKYAWRNTLKKLQLS